MPQPVSNPKRPLWRNFSFSLMWTSTAASGFGDRMIMLAALAMLGGLAAQADSSGVQAGTQFFFFLPYLVFNVIGGWLADHLPRKWLLLACDELRGIILLASYLLLLSSTGEAAIDEQYHWKVYLAVSGIGAFAAMFNPTRNAIIPQIVAKHQLPAANAVVLVINVVAAMIGMVVATKLILDPESIQTVRTVLLLGSIFYLISGCFFAFMRPMHQVDPDRAQKRSMRQAIRYASQHRRVIILFVVSVLVWSSAALVSTGVMGVLKVHYQMSGDPLLDAFAQLSATMGAGMLMGAAIIILIGTKRESAIVLTFGLLMAGVCVVLFASITWMPLSYLAAFGVGVFGNMAIIGSLTVLQDITPNYIRGRVMGLNSLVTTLFSVSVYGIIFYLPDTDQLIIVAMLALGPVLIFAGGSALLRHLRHGTMPNPMANLFWRLVKLFCFSWHRLTVTGKHHVPSTGPVVICANHTTAMDPFLIQASCVRMVRWLMLTSFRIKIGNPLWNAIQPICIEYDNQTGERSNATKQLRQIVGELKKGDVVGMFPEGHLQYDHRVLAEFEEGAAAVARLAQAVIVPCWIEGTVLSKSMLKHALKRTHSSVTFGEPIVVNRRDRVEDITAEIRRRVVELGEQEQARRAAQA